MNMNPVCSAICQGLLPSRRNSDKYLHVLGYNNPTVFEQGRDRAGQGRAQPEGRVETWSIQRLQQSCSWRTQNTCQLHTRLSQPKGKQNPGCSVLSRATTIQAVHLLETTEHLAALQNTSLQPPKKKKVKLMSPSLPHASGRA